LRDPGQHHMKGLHPTGIFGAVAAAAACASLHGLDAAVAAQAIALGASQSAGLMSNFGSMAKCFHAGRAAQSGIMAARLAKAGFSSSPDALEHPQGFLSAFSPNGEYDAERPVQAGQVWQILNYGLSIKKYPMCFCCHRPIDALLDLQATEAIPADEVERVTVRMSGRNARVLRNHRPRTGLEAKFSIEFAMAAALVAGRVGLPELADEFVAMPAIQMLLPRVHVDADPREDSLTGYAPSDHVTIHTRDGRQLTSQPVVLARGAWGVPLSEPEIWTKFVGCLIAGGYVGDRRRLFDRLRHLQGLTRARELLS
jgi:2-methylcitrate dehydratase PrpD